MKTLHGTYVHRGDRLRRRKRYKQTFLAATFLVLVVFLLGNRIPVTESAIAAPVSKPSAFRIDFSTNRSLGAQLDSARGELGIAHAQLERANRVISFSSGYAIPAGLAAQIFDVASAEGIDPELAFRLVKLESDFKVDARSPVGALGLTQVMPSTAAFYNKGITSRKLLEPQINLRVGFRYLRGLVDEYKGDMSTALLVYNRGPAAVQRSRAAGVSASNGYDRIVTRGYKGKGFVN